MKNLKILSVIASVTMVSLAWQPALGQNVKIVANSNVTAETISATQLKVIFLEESLRFAGSSVEPVIRKSGTVHDTFLREYVGRDADALQTYYRTLVFNGRGSMPKTLGSDAEVVAYVAKTKGAIGYVSAAASTDKVKILVVTSGTNNGERSLIAHPDPEYPDLLRKLHIGGTVRLRVTISAKGNVENAELLGGNPILGESAIAAVKRWVYTPGNSRTTAEVAIPFDPGH